ncbi:MAG: DUF222 domain-containing protein [Actinomycetota bacterium]
MTTATDISSVRRSVADALTAAINRSGAATTPLGAATRAARRARAAQLDEVRSAIADGSFRRLGHRSPTDWLAATTHDSIGQCRATVMLVDRLPHLPALAGAFRDGSVAEAAIRLMAQAWRPDVADAYGRAETQLLDWATALPHRDFKLVFDTWRRCVDQERLDAEAAGQFERRSLRITRDSDGLGRLDGVLDPEGLALVREAIRSLSAPTELDERTIEQRRADALVDMARITLDVIAQPAPDSPTEPPAGCDAHHARHWLDLGETNDDNLVLLCRFHHHELHEQHWSIEPLGAGNFALQDPDGAVRLMRPPIVGLHLHAA